MAGDSRLSRLHVRGDALESAAPSWRRLPGDPKTAWGWIFRKRFEFVSVDHKAIAKVVYSALTISLIIVFTRWTSDKPFQLSHLIPALFISAMCARSMIRWRLPTSNVHTALPTLTEEREALPVLLIVDDEFGQPTGKDHGWVAFADGWLVYEGLRTEFTLTKAAVGLPYEFAPGGVTMKIADERRITLKPIAAGGAPGESVERGDEQRLIGRIQAWLSDPIPEGLSTFPPRALHPEVARERLAFPPAYAFTALFLAMISNAFFGPGIAWAFVAASVGCAAWAVVGLVVFARRLPKMIR